MKKLLLALLAVSLVLAPAACGKKPEPTDGTKDDSWGSFYLNPADVKEGYYDLVFTVDGKASASVLARFYKPEELIEKSDAELEQIQKGLDPLKVK